MKNAPPNKDAWWHRVHEGESAEPLAKRSLYTQAQILGYILLTSFDNSQSIACLISPYTSQKSHQTLATLFAFVPTAALICTLLNRLGLILKRRKCAAQAWIITISHA